MYRLIGADDKEYGPVSAELLRQWIAEGRLDGRTRVLLEGTKEWKPLSEFPEFAAAASATPPTLVAPFSSTIEAAQAVSGPAIALMITAILGFLLQSLFLVFRLVINSVLASQPDVPSWLPTVSGTVGVTLGIVVILTNAFIFVGAMKMKSLQNYGLAVAASIVAMIPCSLCCVLGLPFGIWALVVLAKPEVKSAFR